MREILFRGKTGFGAWVHGDLIHRQVWKSKFEVIRIDDNGFDNYTEYEVATETIGQYTGLTDKNGNKIFEGDVLRVCLDPEIRVGDVIWDSEIASYNIPFNDGKCVLPLDIFIAKNKVGDKVWIEAIGNIHDNPELLEVTADG
jgi:uncharacterized phage protein (TIGR01671 family)